MGAFPCLPPLAYQTAIGVPRSDSAGSTGIPWRGNRYRSSVPSFAQIAIWCSFALMRVKNRLRSTSFTSAWTPIFFHCSLIISAIWACGMNAPADVSSSMRSRPLPSVRSR